MTGYYSAVLAAPLDEIELYRSRQVLSQKRQELSLLLTNIQTCTAQTCLEFFSCLMKVITVSLKCHNTILSNACLNIKLVRLPLLP